MLFSGLYRDVQSICLSVTWRAEDKKQQVLDGKVRAPFDVERQLSLACPCLEKRVNTRTRIFILFVCFEIFEYPGSRRS